MPKPALFSPQEGEIVRYTPSHHSSKALDPRLPNPIAIILPKRLKPASRREEKDSVACLIILWRHTDTKYPYDEEPGDWIGYIWSLITNNDPYVELWARSYAPTTVSLSSLGHLWLTNNVWGEQLGLSQLRSLKETIENCGRRCGWAVRRVYGREQFVWRDEEEMEGEGKEEMEDVEGEMEEGMGGDVEEDMEEDVEEDMGEDMGSLFYKNMKEGTEEDKDAETEDETSDESELGSDGETGSSDSEDLDQSVPEPTTAEATHAMVPEPQPVEGAHGLSELISGIRALPGNGRDQDTADEPQGMTGDQPGSDALPASGSDTTSEVDHAVAAPTVAETMTAVAPELKQVERERRSSEPASDIQESLGNGPEQDAASETKGSAEDQLNANTVPANGSGTSQVDMQNNSDGRLAWMLKAGCGWFRWHNFVLAVLIVFAFLWPCHSECLES